MQKSKFNKKKCASCIYRKKSTKVPEVNVFCDYAGVTDQTCLHRVGSTVVDRRGDDYEHCKLRVVGDPIVTQHPIRF